MRKYQKFLVFRLCSFFLVPMGIISCAPISYDYVGNWEQQGDTRVFTNEKFQMRLSFPNENWLIYDRPPTELEQKWSTPERRWHVGYHLLMAYLPQDLRMELYVQPIAEDVSLEGFLALKSYRLLVNQFEIENEGAHIQKGYDKRGLPLGVITIKFHEDEVSKRQLQAVYKEHCRVTILSFTSPETFFKESQSEIWEIINSYDSPQYIIDSEQTSQSKKCSDRKT